MTRSEALVIGATPGGLVAAVDLGRRSIPVRVLGDEVDAPVGQLTFQPRTTEILYDLGLLEGMLPYATVPHRKRPVEGMPYPDPITVPATAFSQVVRERLVDLGVEVERHSGLVEVVETDDGKQVRFSRETVHAQYVLAASPSVRPLVAATALRAGRRMFFADSDQHDLAIQDAYNLAWKLSAVFLGANTELLDSYETERSFARQRPTKEAHYRDSPMSQELGGQKLKLRAGDRVPDLRLWSPEHGDIRMFDLLRGTRWTILGIGSITAEPVHSLRMRFGTAIRTEVVGGGAGVHVVPGITVTDRYGDCRRHVCRRGGSILAIRPDGYLGLRTNTLAPIVGAYLEDVIGLWSDAQL